MCTDDLIFLPGQYEFDEANGFVLSLRAVYVGPGEFDNADLLVLLLSFAGRESNACSFWIGKGTPGHNTVIDLLLANRQYSVTHCDSCLVCSDMGEEVPTNHVSDSK